MIISGFEATECILRLTALFTNKSKQAFLITMYYIVLFFYDVNLTISKLDRPITAEFTKGISMKTFTYQTSFVYKQITIIILQITE